MSATLSDLSGLNRTLHTQESWEWPIALYLYLAGIGSGAMAVGLITDWILHPDLPSRAVLLWGPILVAIGAPFLILDLGKKKRFLNACLNPMTSWAARGFLILSTLIVTGMIVFAVSLLPWALPYFGFAVPAWLDANLPLFRALEIVAVIFAFGTAAYTGVFLKSTRYVALWNTWLLPILFLISAMSTGSMGVIVSLFGAGEITHNEAFNELAHTIMSVEQGLVAVEAVVLALFMAMRNCSSEVGKCSVRLLLKGRMKFVFWGGVVVLGLALPPVLEFVYSRFPNYPALIFITGASLLTGGFFLRYGVVKGGIKDEHPLHKMAPLQYDWKAMAQPHNPGLASRGEGVRDI